MSYALVSVVCLSVNPFLRYFMGRLLIGVHECNNSKNDDQSKGPLGNFCAIRKKLLYPIIAWCLSSRLTNRKSNTCRLTLKQS